ncbi:hypothetical protein B484DRAFT_398953 [Ochromonadaceae sp. CCMP2298]|nr:hypothetical protein B484DRAFT_398953 [Ochromonadaceae sp. CCMP2298]
MPNITLIRDHLFEAIGRTYTDEEFDELCFEFGVEVDGVETEVVEFTGDGSKEEHVVYIIAIPANRYDLLCMEGFTRAIRIFLGLEKSPTYRTVGTPQESLTMHVEPATSQIRPFVVCAVLRGVTFDKKVYKSFIDLQEKLHQNVCRRRTYVAIGTHDLDTLQGPFRYKAQAPADINFVPLTENAGKSYGGKELLDFYRSDPSTKHLKPYTDIIYESPVYPVLYDSTGRVLSMPPIINGKHSRIQMHTKNVFIECTGTDLTKCNIVLDTVVTMFAEHCAEPFTVEPVKVVYEATGETHITPLLSRRTCDTPLKDITSIVGVDIPPEEICRLCDRMQLGPSEILLDLGVIRVNVPPTRSDVLHPVDVVEDVAIAYGFNNIPLQVPPTQSFGCPLPINQFCDLLRQEIARAGYVEMLTHGLCSTAENFSHLRRPIGPAVSLSNPANVEYEVVRTTLVPGALKTLSFNKALSHKEGIRLFEISDVVIPTDNEVGAMNCRRLVGLYSSNTAGFEVIHGLADRVMTAVQIQPDEVYAKSSLSDAAYADAKRVGRPGVVYSVRQGSDPLFFPGMSAELVLHWADGRVQVVGCMGAVHPEVLQNFDVSYPASVVEIDIEALM